MIDIKTDLENEKTETNLEKISLGIGILILIAAAVFFSKYQAANIPPRLILQVPFSAQAPTDNWDRNEDCEETSITMANSYLTGNTSDKLPAAAAQNAINNLKAWESKNLGYNENTGADATTKLAEGAFNLKIDQIKDFTSDDLKKALLDNHPILLPINAKLLNNPQYKNGGPLYHMIVVRGYKGDTFIVNDPGTNNGDGNEYSFTTLQNAAADWDNATKTIDTKIKIALIVSR